MAEQQFVVFKLQDEEYGLDIQQVNEILLMQEVTKYPQTGDFIEGIINLRGKIIPIIDLKKKFYGMSTEITDNSRIVVVTVGEQLLGLIVDEVSEVIILNDSMIEPTPTIIANMNEGVKGIGKLENRLLILLDLNRAFSLSEIRQLEAAVS